MSKKKILFTSHTANFQKFNRPFMRMLSEQGYEVHYASMGEEEILDADKAFTVPFTRSPFRLSNVKAYKQLKKIIDRENYDIIHTHTPVGSIVTRMAARSSRKKRGTKVIYTNHGAHFFKGGPLLGWLLWYPVERFCSRFTDEIVTINSEDYHLVKERFLNKNTHWLKSGVGVDIDKFSEVTSQDKLKLRVEYGYSYEDKILIYVAEFIPRKNHTLLIDAFENLVTEGLSDIKLVLCGTGEDLDLIKRIVVKKRLSSSVDFVGYTDKVDHYMKLSDVYVSTSIQEGQQLTLIESMACGLIPVSSDIRGPRDVIEMAGSGHLFDLKSDNVVDDLSAAIRAALLESSSQTSVKPKVDQFSLESALARMRIIYESA